MTEKADAEGEEKQKFPKEAAHLKVITVLQEVPCEWRGGNRKSRVGGLQPTCFVPLHFYNIVSLLLRRKKLQTRVDFKKGRNLVYYW